MRDKKTKRNKQKKWTLSDDELESVLNCLQECLEHENGISYIYDNKEHQKNLDFLNEFEDARSKRDSILAKLTEEDYEYTVEAKDENFLKKPLHVFRIYERLVRLNADFIMKDSIIPSLENFEKIDDDDGDTDYAKESKSDNEDLYDNDLSAIRHNSNISGEPPREKTQLPLNSGNQGSESWVYIYIKFYVTRNGDTVAVVSFHEDGPDEDDYC
ncbi:MAG: hypothetical protein LUD72_01630 [Bacteroidales bacterium]|nr:hypothetical protein [Bacteroidales bacterium]